MPLQAGEVESVLRARNEMSGAFKEAGADADVLALKVKAAALEVKNFEKAIQEYSQMAGGAGSKVVAQLSTELEGAKGRLAEAQTAAQGAGVAIEGLGANAGKAGDQLSAMDKIATRMIERLLLLYALRASYDFVTGLFTAAAELQHMSDNLGISTARSCGEDREGCEDLSTPSVRQILGEMIRPFLLPREGKAVGHRLGRRRRGICEERAEQVEISSRSICAV